MLTITDHPDCVRLACETCGAHATFEPKEHESLVKLGRRMECEVCGCRQDPRAQLQSAA